MFIIIIIISKHQVLIYNINFKFQKKIISNLNIIEKRKMEEVILD